MAAVAAKGADEGPAKRSPQRSAWGPIGDLFFLWISPTMNLGRARPLRADEAIELPSELEAQRLCRAFSEHHASGCSVPKALWFVCRWQLLKAIGVACVGIAVKLAATMVMRRITELLMDLSVPLHEGLLYAVGLWLLSVTDALALTHATLIMSRLTMSIFNIFAMTTYNKAHELHPFSRDKYKRGDLVNLGLTDCARLVEVAFILVTGMVVPIQLVGSIALALFLVGPEVLVMLLWMTLIVLAFKKVGEWQTAHFMRKMMLQGKRISTCNEMLQSMKMVKLGAWEEFFQGSLEKIRAEEERAIRRFRYYQSSMSVLSAALPALSMVTILPLHIAVHGDLPSVPDTFALMHILRAIMVPFTFLGFFFSSVAWLHAACGRLTKLLAEPSLERRAAVGAGKPPADMAVQVSKASFSWVKEQAALSDIDLAARHGELVFVVGHLGQGKSSLLQALLGEMAPPAGAGPAPAGGLLDRAGGVAYTSQQAFVTNCSLRENVLFGKPLEQERYETALHAAGLDLDLALLPQGDETEIGEKGVTLSGGQRARVGLARAAYSGASVHLLDDPFAALDMEVGKHVFEELLCGVLGGATRIVTSSQLHMLSDPRIDRIVVVKEGRVVQDGKWQDLSSEIGSLQELMRFSFLSSSAEGEGEEEASKRRSEASGRRASVGSLVFDKSGKSGRVTVDEKKEDGAVSFKTMALYRNFVGSPLVVAALLAIVWVYVLGEFAPDIWISLWQANVMDQELVFYLGVWLALVAVGLSGMLVSRLTVATVASRAATKIHNAVLARVLRCPISFFDQTPTGRLLSRFGEDQMGLDVQLGAQVEATLLVLFKTILTCLVVMATVPWVAVILAFLGPSCWIIATYQRATVRESMRWWLLSKGPLFNIFEESLSGVATIRAFGAEERFLNRFKDNLDTCSAWNYTRFCANAWGELRLMLSSSCMVGAAAIVVVLTRESVVPAMAAMSLMYAFLLAEVLRFLTALGAQAESQLAAVERAQQVLQAPQEACRSLESDKALKVPEPGASVVFEGVVLRYQEHLDPALRGISFAIQAGERVGVVGRSGSGKSTLLLALLRLVEPCGGTVKVGGYDVAKMGLRLLRSTVTIIPQDPIMFSGNLQKNLDPTGACSVEDMLQACRKAGLEEMRASFALDEVVQEGGSNFSHGERQLVCMVRALLRRNPVMLFDEATASVDVENDARLQAVLREDFAGSTIITVAHRLNTIIDYDRILALSTGEVAEFAPPAELLEIEGGVFAGLAKEAGLTAASAAKRPSVGSSRGPSDLLGGCFTGLSKGLGA